MSVFASLTTSDRVPLPFDEGQWVKVRKLTGSEYEAAQVAHRVEFVAGDKWAGLFRRALEQGPSAADVQKALADPLTGFNRYVLVRAGLVAWSYDGAINRVEPAADVYDAIRDLDDDAVDFIAREVLKLTKPGLFVETPEAADEEKKSGS